MGSRPSCFTRHNLTRKTPVVRVVLEQMRHGLDSADVIDGDNIDFLGIALAL